jgi:hypothetical protein
MFGYDPSLRATVAVLLAICTYVLLLALKQGSIEYPAPFFWWIIMAKVFMHESRVWAATAEPEEWSDAEALDGAPAPEPITDPSYDPQRDPQGYALGY